MIEIGHHWGGSMYVATGGSMMVVFHRHMPYHFRNLVFEGGGVRGIAYVGAMEVLAKKGILSNIQRVGGTSVGAINATLVALGFSNAEQRDILWKLDFKNFLDDSWGVFRNTERLLNKFGLVQR